MIIRIEDIKNLCSKILFAVDNSEASILTETVELKTYDGNLYLCVTNREYYVQVKFKLDTKEDFHATVNANLFLKLVSNTTSETIEFIISDKCLIVKGNGTYKIPLIYNNDVLLELPKIEINNVTTEMVIDNGILNSIINYNSKELSKGNISRPVQRYYYIDESGCITFTSGACVNNFTLEKPIRILLNNKIVKLFKLFKGSNVKMTLGCDAIADDIIQTKVKFEDDTIELTAILSCDDTLINSVPVTAIRARASETYPYSIVLNKDILVQTIKRLLLFAKENEVAYGTFEFNSDYVFVHGNNKENYEKIYYENGNTGITKMYEAMLDLNDLKLTLESCNEQYVSMSFGDTQAFVLSRCNISNIIPEIKQVF